MCPMALLATLQIREDRVSFACNVHDNSAVLSRLHASVGDGSDKSQAGLWDFKNRHENYGIEIALWDGENCIHTSDIKTVAAICQSNTRWQKFVV